MKCAELRSQLRSARTDVDKMREALEIAKKAISSINIPADQMPPDHFVVKITWDGNAILGFRGRDLRALCAALTKICDTLQIKELNEVKNGNV